MNYGFQQVRNVEDLGEELPYLRGELVDRLRRMAHGRIMNMLQTPEGEAHFIEQMDKVYVYPRFSELMGEAWESRIPYMAETPEGSTINLPPPERLMSLMLLNFYDWQGRTIFSTANRQAHDGHVWMAVDNPDSLVSSLGLRARLSPHLKEWTLGAEVTCGSEFLPLASLPHRGVPPLLKNKNPGDLRESNLKHRSRRPAGRPMKCVDCGSATIRDQSQIVRKERLCFSCLRWRMKSRLA